MKVGVALFGERNLAHALLDFSGGDPEVFVRIRSYTDRRSAVHGSYWGFPEGDNYYLLRTWHDLTAKRGGMRRTIAIAIDLETVKQVEDLRWLLVALPEIPPDTLPMVSISFATSTEQHSSLSEGSREKAATVFDSLLNDEKPAIWLDDGDYVDGLCHLWSRLPGELRPKLSFRSAAEPDDDIAEWHIVSTPLSRVAQWREYSLASGSVTPHLSAAMLLLDGHLHELLEFAHSQGAHLSDFSDIQMVEDIRTFAQAPELTVSDAASLLRKSVLLLPAQSNITTLALTRLEAAIESSADVETVRVLRNIEQSRTQLNHLSEAITLRLRSADAIAPQTMSALLLDLTNAAVQHWWREAVRLGIVNYFKGYPERAKVMATWDLLIASPASLSALAKLAIDLELWRDQLKTHAADALDKREISSATARVLGELGWFDVYAAAMLASSTPAAALRHLLSFEPSSSTLGVAYLATFVEPQNIVALAIETGDRRLVDIAGEVFHTIRDPKPDMSDVGWHQIVAVALERGNASAELSSRLPEWLRNVPSALLSSPDVIRIWNALSSGAPAALIEATFPWELVPDSATHSVRQGAADFWLRYILQGGIPAPLPADGADVAADLFAMTDLDCHRPAALLTVFERLPTLTENSFLSTAERIAASGDDALIRRASTLVRERNWSKAARALAAKAQRVATIFDLFFMFTPSERLGLAVRSGEPETHLDSESWWRVFREIGSALYPHGVEERSLLSRAKGNVSLISMNAAGAEQWHELSDLLEKGGAGTPVTSVLQEMRIVFPYNGTLENLEIAGRSLGIISE